MAIDKRTRVLVSIPSVPVLAGCTNTSPDQRRLVVGTNNSTGCPKNGASSSLLKLYYVLPLEAHARTAVAVAVVVAWTTAGETDGGGLDDSFDNCGRARGQQLQRWLESSAMVATASTATGEPGGNGFGGGW
uniref:Uncharacterized protein n=1 Tax=Oryza punctata TaxID=4537 RepID=A0A0E0KHK5_ORYPU